VGTVRVTGSVAVDAARRVGLTPAEAYPGNDKAPWRHRCGCGAEVSVNYNKILASLRAKRVRTCTPCSYRLRGENRKLTQDDARARMIEAGAVPLEPYVRSDLPWRSLCLRCKREVHPSLSSAQAQGPCGYCGGNRSDLDEVYARMDAADLIPLEPFPGVDHPWRCRCRTCGKEPTPRYGDMKYKGQGGCKYCAGVAVDPTEAFQIMLDAGLQPLSPYPGGNKTDWPCVCLACGRRVSPRYNTIQQGIGQGCEPCGKVRGGLKRRVPEENAMAIMFAAGLTPLVAYPGAMKPWKSRCVCGATTHPSLHNVQARTTDDQGCRACRVYFDLDLPGSLYLVVSTAHKAIKIGIMKTGSARLDEHRREGWLPYTLDGVACVWDVASLRDAYLVEQQVLTWWREDLGVLPAVGPLEMRQKGATETARLDAVDADATVRLVAALLMTGDPRSS
jgi:hypothetical protein